MGRIVSQCSPNFSGPNFVFFWGRISIDFLDVLGSRSSDKKTKIDLVDLFFKNKIKHTVAVGNPYASIMASNSASSLCCSPSLVARLTLL